MQATLQPPTTTEAQVERAPWLRVTPEDGWLTLVLLMAMVFTTISSIQNVTPAWADGLDILTTTAAMGLLLGYLSVQQGRLPSWLVQIVATAAGILFAFQQTTDRVSGGNRLDLWRRTETWFHDAVLLHQSSDDNRVFLLFLAILSFLLAYISVWLVIQTRRPWLAALANGVVLLINLDAYTAERATIFLVVFLLITLLLLVRFTLSDNMRRWRARGLRFSPDLTWDFMQAGAIFVVVVLLLSYLLPASAANSGLNDFWNSPANPVQFVSARVAQVFNGVGGKGPGTFAFFGDNLKLTGSVTLTDAKIMQYTVPNATDDSTQYLMTATLDTYDGQNSWSSSQPGTTSYHAGDQQPSATNITHTNTYHIRFLVSLAGNRLYAPGDEVAGFSVASRALAGSAGAPAAWFSNEALSAGDDYVAAGYVSSATQDQLRAVPYPADLSGQAAQITYPDGILQEYSSQLNIASEVAAKAHERTQGATSMYDAALRIEDYLRTFHYSLTNPETPPGQDAVAHFLQVKTGYCTFFASAMALMGRSLGMPTRIVEGFTGGTFDEKAHAFVVKGTASHVWTQIYFGQYGWINFEPTSSFSKFNRAFAPGPGGSITPGPGTAGPGGTPTAGLGPKGEQGPNFNPNANGQGGANPLVTAGLGASLFIALLLLCLVLALTWWRLLFRGLPPVAAAFARVARLGAWAGATPQRSQTPSEYADELGGILPGQRQSLRRLSDIYTRERWGGGASPDALREMPRLYDRVRVAATRVIVQRLRGAPHALVGAARRERARRRHRLE